MSDDRNFPQDWMTADSEIGIKSCLCGKDACIGASNLRPFYRCVREAGEAAIADMVSPKADAGAKRPTSYTAEGEWQCDFDAAQFNFVFYDALQADRYMDSLELQLKTAQREIANYKAGAADSKDWEEMFYADIGAPICDTCNKRCAPHSLAWAVREFKRLQDVELQLTQTQGKNVELAERVKELEFLSPAFLAAMNDIGRYGHHKYGEQSFQHRRVSGDLSRGDMDRTLPDSIAGHAARHFSVYLAGIAHDHFNTLGHQLAAVAFNAMMEFYFAGLESESCVSSAASGKDGE